MYLKIDDINIKLPKDSTFFRMKKSRISFIKKTTDSDISTLNFKEDTFYYRDKFGISIIEIRTEESSYRHFFIKKNTITIDSDQIPSVHKKIFNSLLSNIIENNNKQIPLSFLIRELRDEKTKIISLVIEDKLLLKLKEFIENNNLEREVNFIDILKEDQRLIFRSQFGVDSFGLFDLSQNGFLFIHNADKLNAESISKLNFLLRQDFNLNIKLILCFNKFSNMTHVIPNKIINGSIFQINLHANLT